MKEGEDWGWLTVQTFLEFAKDKGVSLDCSKCPSTFPAVFIDTVTNEGLIPRSSTFGTNRETGGVNLGNSRHLPCARVICKSCGHVSLFSMYAVKSWKAGGDYGAE